MSWALGGSLDTTTWGEEQFTGEVQAHRDAVPGSVTEVAPRGGACVAEAPTPGSDGGWAYGERHRWPVRSCASGGIECGSAAVSGPRAAVAWWPQVLLMGGQPMSSAGRARLSSAGRSAAQGHTRLPPGPFLSLWPSLALSPVHVADNQRSGWGEEGGRRPLLSPLLGENSHNVLRPG